MVRFGLGLGRFNARIRVRVWTSLAYNRLHYSTKVRSL